MTLDKHLIAQVSPQANKQSIIEGSDFRITVLTPEMVRVEIGSFTDNATQAVWFRNFDQPKFSVSEKDSLLLIETEKVCFYYDKMKKKVSKVTFNGEKKPVKVTNRHNLRGTYRTLDGTFSWIPLGKGIMSTTGISVLDDTKSLLLENGEIVPRTAKGTDKYIFAYNKDFRKSLFDFFQLTGKAPLVPRYSLGNWWSRYRAYTQKEYVDLMERFKSENIPITVATIDMDWHWVDVNEKFSLGVSDKEGRKTGWTGYSWNTDLFPDYKGFLQYLHNSGFKTTLNLHPAEGVSWFEDMYSGIAKEMGIDPASKKKVDFDITDPKFINAYFKYLHNPYEDEGVDFWWIDWQQGKNTKIKGLDPLWALNHYHYLNSHRNNKRPLILSRFAKAGSHRYPLGFSGDTFICWAALRFQPYFTANAANIGYTWWSHDIGGHMFGVKSDELYLRWLQFGVFSPINRLHSTSNDLQGKEPWNFSDVAENISKEFLTLRHRLIPYIYSMNYRNHIDGIALCEPMYYAHPNKAEAYKYKNQYMFGSELLVAPAVTKLNKKLLMSKTSVWLPEGRWTDIFTDRIYTGGKVVDMHRGLSSIPVLAKEGAIIPFGSNIGNDCSLPEKLTLDIYRGNNTFKLYEDDGETMEFAQGKYAVTEFSIVQNECIEFIINKTTGETALVPQQRQYELLFKDIIGGTVTIEKNGESFDDYEFLKGDKIALSFTISPEETIRVIIKDCVYKQNDNFINEAITVLSKYQGKNNRKMCIYKKLKNITDREEYITKVKKCFIDRSLKKALLEVLID